MTGAKSSRRQRNPEAARENDRRYYERKKMREGTMVKSEELSPLGLHYVLGQYIQLIDGSIAVIQDVPADAFRDWMCYLVDESLKCVEKKSDAFYHLRKLKNEVRKETIDGEMRWWSINELRRLKTFRDSGIKLFTDREVFAS